MTTQFAELVSYTTTGSVDELADNDFRIVLQNGSLAQYGALTITDLYPSANFTMGFELTATEDPGTTRIPFLIQLYDVNTRLVFEFNTNATDTDFKITMENDVENVKQTYTLYADTKPTLYPANGSKVLIRLLNGFVWVKVGDTFWLEKHDIQAHPLHLEGGIIEFNLTNTTVLVSHRIKNIYFEPIMVVSEPTYFAKSILAETYENAEESIDINKIYPFTYDSIEGRLGIFNTSPEFAVDVSGTFRCGDIQTNAVATGSIYNSFGVIIEEGNIDFRLGAGDTSGNIFFSAQEHYADYSLKFLNQNDYSNVQFTIKSDKIGLPNGGTIMEINPETGTTEFFNNVIISTLTVENYETSNITVYDTVKAKKYTADPYNIQNGNMKFFDKTSNVSQFARCIHVSEDSQWLLASTPWTTDLKGEAVLYKWDSMTSNYSSNEIFANVDSRNLLTGKTRAENVGVLSSAMTKDALTMVVYDPAYYSFVSPNYTFGRVKVYRRQDTASPFDVNLKFTGYGEPTTINTNVNFGAYQHGMTDNGDTIIVGAPNVYQTSANRGKVYSYRWNSSTSTYDRQIITGVNLTTDSLFGTYTAVSGDGTWLACFVVKSLPDNLPRILFYKRPNSSSDYVYSSSLKPFSSFGAFRYDYGRGMYMSGDGTILTLPTATQYIAIAYRNPAQDTWVVSSQINLGTPFTNVFPAGMSADGKYFITRSELNNVAGNTAKNYVKLYEWTPTARTYVFVQEFQSQYGSGYNFNVLGANITKTVSNAYELFITGFRSFTRITTFKPLLIRGFNDFVATSVGNSVEVKGLISSPTLTGMITCFAGTRPPPGWLLCDGRTVSQTVYADLYALIGNTYSRGTAPLGTFYLPYTTTTTFNSIRTITCIKY